MRSPVSPRTPDGTDTAVQAIEDRCRPLAENTNDAIRTMSPDGAITYNSLRADSFHAGIATLTASTSVTASKPRGTQTSCARRAPSMAVCPPSPFGDARLHPRGAETCQNHVGPGLQCQRSGSLAQLWLAVLGPGGNTRATPAGWRGAACPSRQRTAWFMAPSARAMPTARLSEQFCHGRTGCPGLEFFLFLDAPQARRVYSQRQVEEEATRCTAW